MRTHKHLKIVVILLSALAVLSFLGFFLKEDNGEQKNVGQSDVLSNQKVPMFSSRSIEEKTESYEISVSVPVLNVAPLGNEIVNKKLSEMAEKAIVSFKDTVKDTEVRENMKSTLDAGFTTSCTKTVCSILFSQSVYYSGAAHPFTVTQTAVFDKATGKELTLSDVFVVNDAFYTKLTSLVTAKAKEILLEHHKDDKEYTIDTDWIKEGLKDKEKSFAQFMLNESEVTFYFDEYQLAPRVESLTEISLPLDSLQEFKK